MKRCLACLACIMLFYSLTDIPAQDEALQAKPPEAQEDQRIKVQTELMEVRAVVTDRDGHIIEDLKKEDFDLLENDEPQEISFFSISQIEGKRSQPVGVSEAAEARTSHLYSSITSTCRFPASTESKMLYAVS